MIDILSVLVGVVIGWVILAVVIGGGFSLYKKGHLRYSKRRKPSNRVGRCRHCMMTVTRDRAAYVVDDTTQIPRRYLVHKGGCFDAAQAAINRRKETGLLRPVRDENHP